MITHTINTYSMIFFELLNVEGDTHSILAKWCWDVWFISWLRTYLLCRIECLCRSFSLIKLKKKNNCGFILWCDHHHAVGPSCGGSAGMWENNLLRRNGQFVVSSRPENDRSQSRPSQRYSAVYRRRWYRQGEWTSAFPHLPPPLPPRVPDVFRDLMWTRNVSDVTRLCQSFLSPFPLFFPPTLIQSANPIGGGDVVDVFGSQRRSRVLHGVFGA